MGDVHLIQDVRNAVFKNQIRLHNQDSIDEIPATPNRDDNGGARLCPVSCTVFQTRKIEHLIYQNMA